MSHSSLLEREREVEESRAKLTQDLAVLCSSETIAAFTDDLKQEAFDTRDVLWEKLKARAASNPAAVMAIGAGLVWRLFQKPPIASALIGVGLFSLWKTQSKMAYDATGRRLDYVEQSKEILKEQAGEALSKAADFVEKAQRATTAKGSEAWDSAKDKIQTWQQKIGDTINEATSKVKASGEDAMADIQAKQHDLRDDIRRATADAAEKIGDDDTRNTLLLGIAGVAIAAALGIACQKRISETLND
jgi:hypothetical protein